MAAGAEVDEGRGRATRSAVSFAPRGCQAINPAAQICRLQGHQDSHLKRDLDRRRPSQKLRLNATTSGTVTPWR